MTWLAACTVDDIEPEDVRRFDHGERTFAVFRDPDGGFHATDGLCTHGRVHLAGGLVTGKLVECPKHNGRFDYTTGGATRPPACVALRRYATRIENGTVFLDADP